MNIGIILGLLIKCPNFKQIKIMKKYFRLENVALSETEYLQSLKKSLKRFKAKDQTLSVKRSISTIIPLISDSEARIAQQEKKPNKVMVFN